MVGPAARRAFAPASLKTSTGTTARSNGVPSSFSEPVIEPPAMTLSSAAFRFVIDDMESTKLIIEVTATRGVIGCPIQFVPSRRTPGPIRRVVTLGHSGRHLLKHRRRGLWVPACAGTTLGENLRYRKIVHRGENSSIDSNRQS